MDVYDQCTFTAKLRFSFFRSAFLVFHLPDQLFWLSGFQLFLLFCFFSFSAVLLFSFSAFQLLCFSTFQLFHFSPFSLFRLSPFLRFSFLATKWLWHATPRSLSHLSFSNQLPIFWSFVYIT